MSKRKPIFYLLLVIVASMTVGMILASRLDLAPASSAQTLEAPPMNSAPITGPLTATTFREVAKAVSPAVVNIRTETLRRPQDLSDFFGGGGDFFDRLFPGGGQGRERNAPEPREELVSSRGTGFIIDKDGFILTNNHVVENAANIYVSLYAEDGDEYPARVIGRDPLTDSALIELTEKPDHELPVVRFGDSSQMEPGDWVMAIGNPFGLAHTVSVGVISGNRPSQLETADRRFADVLQTDAAINPGNSGGPLLNLRGEVIGVNTAIATTGLSQGNMGVGFAIPSNAVRELLPQLRTGKITRGRIGVEILPVGTAYADELGLKNRNGAVVRRVERGGAAARAGIEPGDVIVSFNNQPIENSNDLVRIVTNTRPGSTVPARIVRAGREQTVNVTVDELDLTAESTRAARGGAPDAPPAQTSTGFGITMENVTPDVARKLQLENTRGALVTAVAPNSPAERDLLRPGDIIIRVGAAEIASIADAQRELERIPEGGTALLRVLRNSQDGPQEIFVPVTKE